MDGVDFNEIFAPVAKYITIRCIFALGSAMNWDIHQIDVRMVFVNGVLIVKIYIDQPKLSYKKGEKTLCANSTSFVRAEAITEDVVPWGMHLRKT